MIGSYKDITQETHTIIFTNSRKRASGFTPGVFQGMYFEIFISFVHCFGIIIKEKCSPFNQGIIQQPIMYINKVITPMTELSEPPSYKTLQLYSNIFFRINPVIISRSLLFINIRKKRCITLPIFTTAKRPHERSNNGSRSDRPGGGSCKQILLHEAAQLLTSSTVH